ncbi:MAG: Ig-like domain-containing protein [Eubacterium sp.]|nr:Ig-like domain-containing protein [Eubacterium sp.]
MRKILEHKKNRETRKGKHLPYVLLVLAVFAAGLIGIFGDSTQAADEPASLVVVDQFDRTLSPATIVDMETSSLLLTLRKSDGSAIPADAGYNIEWSIPDTAGKSRAELVDTGTKTTRLVKAKSMGAATILIVVTDSVTGDQILTTTCNINVCFAIDPEDALLFKFAKQKDEEKKKYSLFLTQNQAPVPLKLTFGDSDKAQWTVDNEEVAKVGKDTGIISPVAAGKTRVHAVYRLAGETEQTATMDVYVLPRVSAQNETDRTNYRDSLTVALKDGEYLYTNTDYTNQTEPVRSKIFWTISQDDGRGNQVKIADSKNMKSELIELVPTGSYSNELQVKGLAGKYQINFYVYDTYDETLERGTLSYEPTVVNLTIKSAIEDKDETLNIGDSYNFAEAYHMTPEDFKECFDIEFTMPNGGDHNIYKSYDQSTLTLKALAEGVVVAKLKVKDPKVAYIRELLGLQDGENLPENNTFITYIRILDRIQMDRTSMTISVGQTYQLSVLLNGIYDGSITWESSDDKSVSVDNGLIKGLKITQKDVIITATLDAGDGVYRTAVCSVKVEAAVESFTLSPNADQSMLVGDHLVVKAEIRQTVSIAPLDWVSTDTSVFTVEQAADGKSATITAVGGGRADLMVYNTINKQYKVLHITVRVAIDSIKFANESLSLAQHTKGYNIHDEVTYTPANATDNELTWASSDTSVFKVNKDGYITFVGPGTALVSVYPSYNPYNVMASCRVTVLGTPTSMTLSKSEVTMNTKESVMIDVSFSPVNTTSQLTWKPNDKSIVSVSYDSKKQIATLTGLAPGTTDINVTSTEGIVSNVKVTVRQPATSISIKEKDVILLSGDSISLTPVMNPTNATDTLVWESDDTSVATVDSTGTVTGIKPGTTYVFVTAYNGGMQTCFSRVAITVRDAVKGISLPQTEYAMDEGDTITIAPVINPDTAYNKKITWTFSNTTVATMAPVKGSDTEIEVTAIAGGSVMLTAMTEDGGYTASCMIVVTPAPTPTPEPTPTVEPTAEPTLEPTPTPIVIPTKVKVTPATKFLKVGKSFYVKATVTGSTKNKKVKWTSSKKKVCTVTQSGKVKGKKVGTAYIKATAKDGSGASARCKVRVIHPVTKISLKPSSAKILVGDIFKVKATVKPKNATIKKVKWSTKDASIATVDSAGRVIGVAVGMVEIKAKAQDGSGKAARCYITVKEAVEATGVTVANSTITVAKGKAVQSGIVAAPANTTTSIRYYSDNKKVASVDKRGKITTHKVGQATVYGETANGKIGYCDVLVVDLNRKGIEMRQYDTEKLCVNEISDGVTWYSKNINVASVDSSGLVTGRKKGTTIVYAVVNGVKLGCRVKVKKIK